MVERETNRSSSNMKDELRARITKAFRDPSQERMTKAFGQFWSCFKAIIRANGGFIKWDQQNMSQKQTDPSLLNTNSIIFSRQQSCKWIVCTLCVCVCVCVYIYIYIYIYIHTHTHTQPTRVGWKVYRLTKILSWNVTKWGLFFNIVSFVVHTLVP